MMSLQVSTHSLQMATLLLPARISLFTCSDDLPQKEHRRSATTPCDLLIVFGPCTTSPDYRNHRIRRGLLGIRRRGSISAWTIAGAPDEPPPPPPSSSLFVSDFENGSLPSAAPALTLCRTASE
jgi:hypothetical protein